MPVAGHKRSDVELGLSAYNSTTSASQMGLKDAEYFIAL
jgi:hypothetical protein